MKTFEDYAMIVSLKSVPLHNLDSSKVRLSDNKFIVTRVSKEYYGAFVVLCPIIRTYQFIVIQVLKTDDSLVGGLRLYIKSLQDHPYYQGKLWYSDSKCTPKDYFIFWSNEDGEIYLTKNIEKKPVRISSLRRSDRKFQLLGEMYGCVTQLRVFVGASNEAIPFLKIPLMDKCSPILGNTAYCLPFICSTPDSTPDDNTEALLTFEYNGNEIIPTGVEFYQNLLTIDWASVPVPRNISREAPMSIMSRLTKRSTEPELCEYVAIEKKFCKICIKTEANTVFEHCSRMFCRKCAKNIRKTCPVCRSDTKQIQDHPSVSNFNKSLQDYFHPAEPVEITVPLTPLPFDNEQPNDSKVKFNEDRSVATRIGEDYRRAYVYLANSLKSNEVIVIQILKVDRQHVGGLKLYHQCEHNGSRNILFADSVTELYDNISLWMNGNGELFWKKCERKHFLGKIKLDDAEGFKLVCEMYGPVQQIRAYVGYLKNARKKISEPDSGKPEADVAARCLEESNGNAGSSNLQHASLEVQESNDGPYLDLKCIENYGNIVNIVDVVTVANLATNSDSAPNSSAVGSGSNETNEHAVETCNICMDAEADTVIIPCGHLVGCYECSSRVATRCGIMCPICRSEIKSWQKVYSRNAKCQNCETRPADVVLLPCGDMCMCDSCSTSANSCPVCRMFVKGFQKIV